MRTPTETALRKASQRLARKLGKPEDSQYIYSLLQYCKRPAKPIEGNYRCDYKRCEKQAAMTDGDQYFCTVHAVIFDKE